MAGHNVYLKNLKGFHEKMILQQGLGNGLERVSIRIHIHLAAMDLRHQSYLSLCSPRFWLFPVDVYAP